MMKASGVRTDAAWSICQKAFRFPHPRAGNRPPEITAKRIRNSALATTESYDMVQEIIEDPLLDLWSEENGDMTSFFWFAWINQQNVMPEACCPKSIAMPAPFMAQRIARPHRAT